jgi:hypothetical protein
MWRVPRSRCKIPIKEGRKAGAQETFVPVPIIGKAIQTGHTPQECIPNLIHG